MPDGARRASTWRRRAAAGVVVLAAVQGCGGVPTGGGVHLGRALPGIGSADDTFELDVKALPPSWRPGMSLDEVVAGFLHAQVNGDGDYAIARSYLSSVAARTWDPLRVFTTYDGLQLTTTPTATGASRVRLRAARIGRVDGRGDYDPTAGTVDETLTVTRSRGQWKIDRLPPGVLLSSLDAQRSLRPARVYYLNRTGHALVPEQTFLQTTRTGFATALVRTLLAGPGPWLAPAVQSPMPLGTTLIGNVPVDPSGLADVNLSPSVRQATTEQLQGLSAQLVWTLRQVPDITAVRLLADGSPLPVPGVGVRQLVSAWSEFDPAGTVQASGALAVAGGRVVALRGAPRSLSRIGGSVVAAAMSTDGEAIAVVRRAGSGVSLASGPLAGPQPVRLRAAAMTPPSIDSEGDAVTVVGLPGKQRVMAVSRSGVVRAVAADAAVTASSVTALRLSRDGSRVAVVSGGRLLVGRVEVGRDGWRLTGFRSVLPAATDVRGVAWSDPGDLVTTVAAGSGRAVTTVDVDGYAERAVQIEGVTGAPVDVAAAPGQPLLVATTEGAVWADTDGWHRLGAGSTPAYAG
jgi:hypothetical protein